MDTETLDANTEVDSSTALDAKREDSSTPDKTMAEILTESMAKSVAKNPPPKEDEQKEDEEESTTTVVTDEKKPEEDDKPEDEPEEKVVEEDTDKTKKEKETEEENQRWDKHPRSQEYLTKIKDLEEPAKFGKAITEYVRQNRIAPERLDGALQIVALMESNPAKAYELLTPIYDQLAAAVGARGELPKDLLDQVAAGEMTEKVARELFRYRKGGEISTVASQREQAQRQQTEYTTTMNSWVADKQRVDPAYKPSDDANKPGLFELVRDKFTALCALKPPQNLSESIQRAEEAYTSMKGVFKSNQPPLLRKKVMRSTGANRGGGTGSRNDDPSKMKSLSEVLVNTMARHAS